jgi:hypothetical protein
MSRRLRDLDGQIDVLRTRFLPDPFDPLGQYPDPEEIQDYSRAFVVLSHAELESYIEGWAKDIARVAEEVWKRATRVTPPLAFLLASIGERIKIAETLSAGGDDSHARLQSLITKVFQVYYRRIKDNNGIKEKNVLRLFDALGVPAAAYSSTLLPALEYVGSIRGQHAHASAGAVQSPLDPETELKRIKGVVAELQQFDAWLTAYKRRIR